jgi:NDMA-dependent alcohol dehydrogenase
MKIRAAILRTGPGKWEVVELDLDEPAFGEVLVKMIASGLCHTDDHLAQGDWDIGMTPFCGGHEGAGVVVQVGPGVREITEGDHVVLSYLPVCGRCRYCARGQQNLCNLGAQIMQGSRPDDPNSFRMHLDGAPVAQMGGISTFSEYSTVDARACIKVPNDIPLEKACLAGCAVGTGWGSAVNASDLRAGDTVVIMGIGGIGINVVQGAVHAGALNIIAVDPVAFKRQTATAFGATHTCASMDEAIPLAQSLTDGQGADVAIVTVSVVTGDHVGEAYRAIRKAGTVVVTAVGTSTETLSSISLKDLTLGQKRIQGALFGMTSATVDIPRQMAMYQSGLLKLDELVTSTYTLDQINEGYDDMRDGKNIRGVIAYD